MHTIIWQDAENIAKDENISWDMLQDQTVFVTGASGFIGSCVIRGLLYRNRYMGSRIRIVAMVRDAERARKLFGGYEGDGLLQIMAGDVCRPVQYDGRVDYVIHCASNAAPREYACDPVGTMKTNFFGTLQLLEFAQEKNVKKFLYVSTIEVYGNAGGQGKISERDYGYIDAVNPRSCYPISKKACETASVCFSAQYGVPVSIGRLSYIFGAGMKPDDSKVVAVLTRAAAAGGEMVLKSEGSQRRSYTYITDAASGLLTVLLKGEDREAYNIASSLCVTTIADMGRTLEDLYYKEGVRLRFELPSTEEKNRFSPIRDAVLSSEKLKALGWREKVDLRTGLQRMTTSIAEDNA